ncbi:MAG TPA: alpha/beta fold hydrolase [Planctomycetia bacterium]|nr:alpha/beta fold hydrolase [Planctomycetia bacterium]
MLMPFQILGIWLRAILAVIFLGAGIYFLKQWYDHRRHAVIVERPAADPLQPDRARLAAAPNEFDRAEAPARPDDRLAPAENPGQTEMRMVSWEFGWNKETMWLLSGLEFILSSFLLGWIWPKLLRRAGEGTLQTWRGTGEVRRLSRGDGTELHIEMHGPEDGIPIVLTHGWGLDLDEWICVRGLADEYRLIVWDLPGLGQSVSPATADWSMEKLAGDLAAVLELAGDRPAILVGHSIGGMITLTLCKEQPELVAERAAGLVIVNSTFINPCRTAKQAALYVALQKPILEPLCRLQIGLAPLFWAMNALAYLNGSAHWSTSRTSFSGKETRNQLGFLTRYYATSWPSVIARGFLGMFRYDVAGALAKIETPALIITAEKDELCRPSASEHMASTMPNARLETIEGARHCGGFEHAERLEDLIAAFARQNSPVAAVG